MNAEPTNVPGQRPIRIGTRVGEIYVEIEAAVPASIHDSDRASPDGAARLPRALPPP